MDVNDDLNDVNKLKNKTQDVVKIDTNVGLEKC